MQQQVPGLLTWHRAVRAVEHPASSRVAALLYAAAQVHVLLPPCLQRLALTRMSLHAGWAACARPLLLCGAVSAVAVKRWLIGAEEPFDSPLAVLREELEREAEAQSQRWAGVILWGSCCALCAESSSCQKSITQCVGMSTCLQPRTC